jgi:hypothetical protein
MKTLRLRNTKDCTRCNWVKIYEGFAVPVPNAYSLIEQSLAFILPIPANQPSMHWHRC